MPHPTGGDADLFKARPGRLDKPVFGVGLFRTVLDRLRLEQDEPEVRDALERALKFGLVAQRAGQRRGATTACERHPGKGRRNVVAELSFDGKPVPPHRHAPSMARTDASTRESRANHLGDSVSSKWRGNSAFTQVNSAAGPKVWGRSHYRRTDKGKWTERMVLDMEAKELVQGIESGDAPLVVDVRTKPEFKRGHIPGAVNAPLGKILAKSGDLPRRRW